MKIIVAQTAGFCWGVRRAMDRILDISKEKESVCTLGPLIHNNQVVSLLESKGVRSEKDISKLNSGTVVIRAHGTTPETLKALKDKGLDVVNLTCPKVGKVQGIIKGHIKKGYKVVIVGDEGHAEVISLKGYSEGEAFVVGSVEDATKLNNLDKVIVVSQTTFNYDEFYRIVDVIKSRAKEVKEFCTICDSTHRRQDEVKRIASQVDCMIIIGGKHSANTTRLAEISKQYCNCVYHIETEDELKGIDFSSFETVGVSAGASTPNWIINSVVDYLKFLDSGSRPWKKFVSFIFNSGLFRGFSAFLFSFGLLNLFSIPLSFRFSLIAFFYIFSMTVFNNLIDIEGLRFSNPSRFFFIKEKKSLLVFLAFLSLFSLAVLSFTISFYTFLALLFASILGLIYRIKLRFKGNKLRLFDVPGSKNLLYALAWTIVIAVIPFWYAGLYKEISIIAVSFFVFVVVFSGSIFSDIKDIQGDRFYGRETLPILVGIDRSLKISHITVIVVVFFSLSLIFFYGDYIYFSILSIFFLLYYTIVNTFVVKKRVLSPILYEFLLDNFALIPGVIALLFSFVK